MNSPNWSHTIGRAILYAVTTVLVLWALASWAGRASQVERRETAKNVAVLVEQAQLNRELVCLAILQNTNNPAREDSRVLKICDDVGVEP